MSATRIHQLMCCRSEGCHTDRLGGALRHHRIHPAGASETSAEGALGKDSTPRVRMCTPLLHCAQPGAVCTNHTQPLYSHSYHGHSILQLGPWLGQFAKCLKLPTQLLLAEGAQPVWRLFLAVDLQQVVAAVLVDKNVARVA